MDNINNNISGLPWPIHVGLTCIVLFVHHIMSVSNTVKTGLEWFLIVGSCVLMGLKLYDEYKKRTKKKRNEK